VLLRSALSRVPCQLCKPDSGGGYLYQRGCRTYCLGDKALGAEPGPRAGGSRLTSSYLSNTF